MAVAEGGAGSTRSCWVVVVVVVADWSVATSKSKVDFS